MKIVGCCDRTIIFKIIVLYQTIRDDYSSENDTQLNKYGTYFYSLMIFRIRQRVTSLMAITRPKCANVLINYNYFILSYLSNSIFLQYFSVHGKEG